MCPKTAPFSYHVAYPVLCRQGIYQNNVVYMRAHNVVCMRELAYATSRHIPRYIPDVVDWVFQPSIEPNELSSFLSSPSPPPPTEEPHFNHSPISHLLGAGAPSRRMRRRRRRRRRRWRKEKNKKTDDVHPRLLFFLPPPTAGNPFFELLKTISYHRRGIRHLGSDGGGGEGRLALWHSSHYGGGEKGNRSYRRRYAFHTCEHGGCIFDHVYKHFED